MSTPLPVHLPGAVVPANGENECLSLSFAAELGMVEGLLSLADEWAAHRGTYKDDRTSLRLVLEELLLNLCLHANSRAKGKEVRADLVITPVYATDETVPGNDAAPHQGPRRIQRLTVILQDTGPAFNPLKNDGLTPGSASTLQEAVPGGHGLTLVRLLTTEREYTRRHGNNLLKLSLVCTGPGTASAAAHGASAPSSSGAAASGKAFFTALPRLWHGNLVTRQTALFFCISLVMLWGGLLFYYLAAGDSRRENCRKLCAQALHTQNIASSTFLERLGQSFVQFTQGLDALPDHAAILDDDDAFFESLRDGVLIRTVTADTAVLGVVRGERGKPGATLLYRTGDSVSRLLLPLDFDAFVEKSAAGGGSAVSGRSVWAGPIRDLPGDAGKRHAGMLLAKFVGGENDKAVWVGLVITMPWIAATLDALSGFDYVASAFVTEKGEYIVYPPGRSVHNGPQSLEDEAASPAMRELIGAVRNRENGMIPLADIFPDKTSAWAVPWRGETTLAFAHMTIPGWSFLLLVPSDKVGSTPPSLPLPMLLLAVFGPFLVAATARKAASGVIRPLERLSDALRKIADGDLDTPLPAAQARDEISGMLHAFEHVRVTLKHSFANLMEATAAEQRVRNELTLARSIQKSMLPASPPDVPGIRFATSIDMAGEVCGDLFDCFTLPGEPDSAYCLIGDVCGKGIPASVVMSRAMVLARSFLLSGETLPGTLARLNDALLRSSDSLMFVTLMVARLEGKTGRFAWASAGHPPPLIGAASAGGKIYVSGSLPWSGELVLGVKPGCAYTEYAVQLARGQSILLYTDGADEAMASEAASSPLQPGRTEGMRIFGEDRLQAVFTSACGSGAAGPQAVLDEVRAALASHMGASPCDDITLIVVRWDGA
ncbi:SpoIIE family protein phosphatase [Desulfovibrio sp. OttesenSCG-928-G15]|nr:SpoIIE family protein phosphatase [Desulfovibrio sp. OttesenSCG-928-G15]